MGELAPGGINWCVSWPIAYVWVVAWMAIGEQGCGGCLECKVVVVVVVDHGGGSWKERGEQGVESVTVRPGGGWVGV